MSRSVKIKKRNEVYHIEGVMDGVARYDPLFSHDSALKIDLSGVEAVTPEGARRWIEALGVVDSKKIEFYEVSAKFMEATEVNTSLLGAGAPLERIKSLFVPYYCSMCDIICHMLIGAQEISVEDEEIVTPNPQCIACLNPIYLDPEEGPFLHLFIDGT